jgi:2-keto-3-deoxy-L-rhamnonate aldolase RhmA
MRIGEMNGQQLREALHDGQRVYGTGLMGYNHPVWPRIFGSLGLDFVFIDNEHTPMNRETLAWACEAYAANGIAPLLRIPEPSPTLAAMALDGGAHGVIVPYVETVEQVQALVGATKFRPLKGQALRSALEGQFPNDETEAYLNAFNPNAVLVIMIESPAGVANLPALLQVSGVDAVLIGPHDFSISHGIPEDYDHPLFEEQARQVIAVCHAQQVGVGIFFAHGSLERAVKWINWGTNLIIQRADTLYITRGIRHELDHIRLVLGDLEEDSRRDLDESESFV